MNDEETYPYEAVDVVGCRYVKDKVAITIP